MSSSTIPRSLSSSNVSGQYDQLAPLASFKPYSELSELLHDSKTGKIKRAAVKLQNFFCPQELSTEELKTLKNRVIKWSHFLTIEVMKCQRQYLKLYFLKLSCTPLQAAVEIARKKLMEQTIYLPKKSLMQAIDRLSEILIGIKTTHTLHLSLSCNVLSQQLSNDTSAISKEYQKNALIKFGHLVGPENESFLIKEFQLIDHLDSMIALGKIIRPDQALTIIQTVLEISQDSDDKYHKELRERLPRFMATLNFDLLLIILSTDVNILKKVNGLIRSTDYFKTHGEEYKSLLVNQTLQFKDLSNGFAAAIDDLTTKLAKCPMIELKRSDIDEIFSLRELILNSKELIKNYQILIAQLSSDSQIQRLMFNPGQIEINLDIQAARLSEDIQSLKEKDMGCPFQIILEKFWECNGVLPNPLPEDYIPNFENTTEIQELFPEWRLLDVSQLVTSGLLGKISPTDRMQMTTFKAIYTYIRALLKKLGLVTIEDLLKHRLYNLNMLKEYIEENEESVGATHERTSI